ncbi:uncharacterized protein [Diadema setosum]|uniref:uncharacterized protein n=1 Tax=Diadema setosum TaxID=31175 RepID=UPI003B3B6602
MRKLRRKPQMAAVSTGPKPSVSLVSNTPNLKPERRRECLTLSKKDSPRWLVIRDKAGCKTNMELLRWLLTLAEKQLGITARCALQLPEKGKKSERDKCLPGPETEKEEVELEEKKNVRTENNEDMKKNGDKNEQTVLPPSSKLPHTTKNTIKRRSSPRTKSSKLTVLNKRSTLRSSVACKNGDSKNSSTSVLCKDDENSLLTANTEIDCGINDAVDSKTRKVIKKQVTPRNNVKTVKTKSGSGSHEKKTLLTRKEMNLRRCSVRLMTKKVKNPEESRRQRYARRGRVLVAPQEESSKKKDRGLRARDPCDEKLQKESSNNARKESSASFHCSKCPKTYTRESSVKRHEKTHMRDSFVCQDCGKSCKSSSHLWAHKQRTHIRKFKCAHCNRKFGLADQLAKHERTHTGEKPFACQNCDKSFASSQMLNDHKECHSEGRPYLCHECGVSFKRRDAMLHHVRRNHKPRKSFDCNLCEKSFKNKTSLTNHLEFHQNVTEGKKPYKCDICGNVYTTPKTLQGHLNRHMRTETFQCKVCQKVFRCRHHLIRHELVHRNTKPFTCPECNRGFTQHSNMMVHRRMHTGEKPYQCDICGEKFRQNVSLKTHKHKAHDINMWKDNPPPPNVGRPVGTGTGAKTKKSEKKNADSEKPVFSETREICGTHQVQQDKSHQTAQLHMTQSPSDQPMPLQQVATQQPLEKAVKLSSQHRRQVGSDKQQQDKYLPSQSQQPQPQLPLQQQLVTPPQNLQESLQQRQQPELQYHNQVEDEPSNRVQEHQSEQQKQHHSEQSHQEQEQGCQKQHYQEQHDQEKPQSQQSQAPHHEEQHLQGQYQQEQPHQEHHHEDQQHQRQYDQGQQYQDRPPLYQQKNGVLQVEPLGKSEEHITTSNFNSHYRMSSKLSTSWSVPLSSASSHPSPIVPTVASNNLTNLTQYLPPPSPHHHPDNSMPLRQSQFSSSTHQHLQALLEYNPPVTNSAPILHPSPSMPHSSLLNSSLSQTSHVHPHSAPKTHLQGLHRFPKPPFVNFHPHPHQTLLSSPQPSPNSFNLCHTPDLTPPTDSTISCPSPSPLTPLLSSPLTAPPSQDHPNSHSSLPSRPWSMSQHESSNQQAAMALASMHYPPQMGAQSQPRLPYMGYVNPSMQFSLPTHPGSSNEQRWNN